MIAKTGFLFSCLLSFTIFFFIINIASDTTEKLPIKKPNDWFYIQRAFPENEINYSAYEQALAQAEALKNSRIKNGNVSSWIFAGPVNIGGRITDIEMNPENMQIIYAGAATGGVFKSTDGGANWFPVFDEAQNLSIGDIGIDPTDPDVIYVGTGEANCGGGSLAYEGIGVFKSTNGGVSWTNIGLAESRNIGRIVVDPVNSQRVYVAAMGKLFAGNPERGLYRTTNSGASWENVLFISDTTGCIDVAVNPDSPDTIFAAMWERIRKPWGRSYGGITSGLYRSTDGGDSWTEMTNGLPANNGNIGRIGLTISKSNPQIVYAIYADDIGYFDGVFKTTDGGNSWFETNDGALSGLFSSYGWWFGNIRVDPNNPDIVFAMGLEVYKSTNGGQSWNYVSGSMHVDQHALSIHPLNSNFILAGNDGGIYISQNGGSSWAKVNELPITQFYTCEIDNQLPQRLYGGTQDNGTNRTLTGNTNDWNSILGGDGFYVLVDPNDNSFVYAEYQWGGLARSTNGGNSFTSATSGISGSDRHNWNTPVVFDPSNTETLYYGANRLYRSTNRAQSWNVISPDLTNGPGINIPFGTITTIAVAETDSNYIYVGTDDGNVWVTIDGGNNWIPVSSGLPQRWVTKVAVDPNDEQIAYVTFSGYRWDEYLSHIFRTTDGGASWIDISGNLPEAPINDVIVDPLSDSTLFIASDVGVLFTNNLGMYWNYLGEPLPSTPIMDLVFHNDTQTLVAATYGRSMYKFSLDSIATYISNIKVQVPADFRLYQNYPNPFNPTTTIKFTIPLSHPLEKGVAPQSGNGGFVTLKVYDVLGKEVTTLVNEKLSSGEYEVQFNASGLTSGIYFYRLTAGNFVAIKKSLLLK
ncbi:xyloglucanase Xgh74A precursor [bacterium BMS3Abin03]|nr:xyloglucanase Xgh74A precursor [bacterium BMS3Abin03]